MAAAARKMISTDRTAPHEDFLERLDLPSCAQCGHEQWFYGGDVLSISEVEGTVDAWLDTSRSRSAQAGRVNRSSLSLDGDRITRDGKDVFKLGQHKLVPGFGAVRCLECPTCSSAVPGESFYSAFYETVGHQVDTHFLRFFTADAKPVFRDGKLPRALAEDMALPHHGSEWEEVTKRDDLDTVERSGPNFQHACNRPDKCNFAEAVMFVRTLFALRIDSTRSKLVKRLIYELKMHCEDRGLALNSWCTCSRHYVADEAGKQAPCHYNTHSLTTFCESHVLCNMDARSLNVTDTFNTVLRQISKVLHFHKRFWSFLPWLEEATDEEREACAAALREMVSPKGRESGWTVARTCELLGREPGDAAGRNGDVHKPSDYTVANFQLTLHACSGSRDGAPCPVNAPVGNHKWVDGALSVLAYTRQCDRARDLVLKHIERVRVTRRYWERRWVQPGSQLPGRVRLELDLHYERKTRCWLPCAILWAFLVSGEQRPWEEIAVITGQGKGKVFIAVKMLLEEIKTICPDFGFDARPGSAGFIIEADLHKATTSDKINEAFDAWTEKWMDEYITEARAGDAAGQQQAAAAAAPQPPPRSPLPAPSDLHKDWRDRSSGSVKSGIKGRHFGGRGLKNTVPCKFYKPGSPSSCRRGSECTFAHGREQLRKRGF